MAYLSTATKIRKLLWKRSIRSSNEGTDAHRLSEYKLRKVLGEKVRKPKLKYFDKDMDSYTDDYVNYIVETIENIKKSTKDLIVLIEQRLDFQTMYQTALGQEIA